VKYQHKAANLLLQLSTSAKHEIICVRSIRYYPPPRRRRGGYGTSSEYLRELIREDKKRKSQERPESLLLEGLESVDPVAVTPDFWRELWGRVDARKKAKHGGETAS
jgi:antitoxin ParD1/3/4